MHRIILTIGLFFAASGQLLAATVHLYVDNRIARVGQAQASGSSTTTLKVFGFTNVNDLNVAATDSDLQYMGLHILAGTNAPTIATPFKITAVDVTDPLHPVLTVDAAFNGANTPQDDWEFIVMYGSNKLNTGASQTKGSSSTGPVNEINYCISSSALSNGDEGYIHVRGNTGASYTNIYGQFSGFGLIYSASWGSTKTFIIEGYETTAIPSDLAAAADKSSTYHAVSSSNPALAVNVSAGAALYADTALTAKFPKLRFGHSNGAFSIQDPAATGPAITFRCIDIRNASTSGSTAVINYGPSTTSPNLTIDRCIIGSLETTDDNALAVSIGGTGVASTAVINITKSVILGRRFGINGINALSLTVNENHIENYGKDRNGNTYTGLYSVRCDNNSAVTYSAAMVPTNQVRRFVCTNNNIVHTATHSAASTTSIGIHVLGPTEQEICRIHGNSLALYSQATGIGVSGSSAYDIQNNRIIMHNATLQGVAISMGADASVDTKPMGDLLLRVATGTTDANGSNVAADGSTPLALPAHATFKLTGGSATDNAYRYMLARKVATASGAQWSQIWDYVGSTKIAKCTPQFANTPASGDLWEVYRPRQQGHGVIAHNFGQSAVVPTTRTHAVGMFQGCDHTDFFDNTLIGHWNNGLVLKGEFNRVFNNRFHAGTGTLLLKGGSYNDIHHNTFYCANTEGGTGCFDIHDKSNVHNMNSGETPLNASHWSKATGNRIVDNIFIVDAAANTIVIHDNSVGAGSWAGKPSAYPLSQANVVDYNVYYQAHASADLAIINGGAVTKASGKAGLLAAWATYTDARQFGATNDLNSVVGVNPLLVDPANGNFMPQIRILGSDGQMVGASVPAHRANRLPIFNAN